MKNNLVRIKQDMDIEQDSDIVQESVLENASDMGRENHNLSFLIEQRLFGELSVNKAVILSIYFVAISVLEVLAYQFHGAYSIIASRIWLLGGFLCLAGIIGYYIKATMLDIKEKKILPVIIMFSLLIYLAFLVGNLNLTEINPDAAQQAAAGMSSLSQKDLNYTGKAFLGYPNRQYIITALPSLLFGRSIAALHWGFAIPFLLGLLILYCGLRKWAYRSGINTNLVALPLLALFVFPYVTEYYANFEQAIYPISFTMIAIGFYLLMLCQPDMVNIIGLAWTGCMLSNSYTPALATLGLLLVFILMTIVTLTMFPERMPFAVQSNASVTKNPCHNGININESMGLFSTVLLMVELNTIFFFAATLLDNRKDRITQLRSDGNLISLSITSIRDFLTDKNATFLGMLGIIVIIYLIAALTLRLKLRDLIISLWVLGVFAVTNLLTGYTSYQPAWIMQRALVVIPVLVTGITLTVFELIKKKKLRVARGAIVIMALAFACLGVGNFHKTNQSFTYFNHIQPMKYMLQDLEHTVKEEGLTSTSQFNLVVYTDNILMRNAKDYCEYLYPNAMVYSPIDTEFPADLNTKLHTFVYSDNRSAKAEPVEEYSAVGAYDARYDLEVVWYKGILVNKTK